MQETGYREATEYIEKIPMFGARTDGRNKSGNPNLEYVMKKLGHPERKRKAIHIAGTNGKGSTARFAAGILYAKGYSVGIFTSPHLIRINERFAMAQRQEEMTAVDVMPFMDISDEDFADCFMIVKEAVDEAVKEGKLHLSYFEFLFAMAAVYFAKQRPDYVIYETGLGGRLDATNILLPVITAITSISLEHTAYLGDTIREIAWEKAGIIKEGTPVVYNTGDLEADMVVAASAELMKAEAINVAKTEYIINEFTDKTIDFSLYNRYYKYDHINLNTGGAIYQVRNAMTAIVLCNRLFMEQGLISQEELQKGLGYFSWPGRMERIHPNVVLDGAHNPDAIKSFAEGVNRGYESYGARLLFAVAGDKDYEPMIEELCRSVAWSEVYVTSINSERGISAEYIAALFRMYLAQQPEGKNTKVSYDDDIRNAFLQGFYGVDGTGDILFCVGSLYLIGSLKQIAAEVIQHD